MRIIDILKIIKLGRLHFVIGGFLLFCFGAVLAFRGGAGFDSWKFILGYAVVFAAHLSVSYSNDYFDYDADAFVTPTPFSGGSGVLRENPELRPVALGIALLLTVISIISAMAFTLIFSFTPLFIVLVLVGIGLGWAYTAPPVRLAYRGFGEISTIISLGFLLPVSGYLIVNGALDWNILAFSAIFLIYGLMFIILVQIPDSDGDAKAGKRNMVVRMGQSIGMKFAIASAIAATLGFMILNHFGKQEAFGLMVLSVLPLGASIIGRDLANKKGSPVIFTNLAMTALILMILFSNIYLLFNL